MSTALEHNQEANLSAQIADMELAVHKREYGTVWKIIGYISDKPKLPVKVLKMNGTMPHNENEILLDWRAYFNQLLNNKNKNSNSANYPKPAPSNRDIKTSSISFAEVSEAINSLKRNKATR